MKIKFDYFDKLQTILPRLSPNSGEVYFLTLAARNKYLTKEEQQHYGFTGTKMFGNTVVYPTDSWESSFRKLFSNLEWKRTVTGMEFPEKSVVAYIGINPSSLLKAYADFTARLNDAMFKQIESGDKSFLNKIEHKLTSAIGRNISSKNFIDIDIDFKIPLDHKIFYEMDKNDIFYRIISTQGGYHLLIKSDSLRGSKFRLHDHINNLKTEFPDYEIEFNSNGFVPVPGTMQNEHLVEIL